MGTFEPESSSPLLRILNETSILPNSNPLMEKNSSHSSHDEDDALRVPPEQVQKLSNELDKMGNWLLQENHNQDSIQAIVTLRKSFMIVTRVLISCVVVLTLCIPTLNL
jgi:hypothetical protein